MEKNGFVYLSSLDVLYHRDPVIESINIWTAASITAVVEPPSIDLHCLVKKRAEQCHERDTERTRIQLSTSDDEEEETNFDLVELKRKQRSLYINSD